ncbi:hypothetical protein SVA_3163 [Sulfurifustis variabilis]|uniref:Uncharacterized protein n=1 Tax=Sulfurifustis variabilis TaxID=1675686 RepID=A0A1B4VCT1_9GAMM|nr:hypothetical protein [Sulfurifustis variabilis]BAU49711.1 hypothetical protein SVA_3163 [Sulfurifustis variabilis]
MAKHVVWGAFALLLVSGFGMAAPSGNLPMPPEFEKAKDPRDPLAAYPLGQIDKQAAFLHHGKAHRFVTLPNGKEGWVYTIGGEREHMYRGPTGQTQTVRESHPESYGARSFTLEFDDQGRVIDVLYNEKGPHNGLTALQVQREKKGDRPSDQEYPPKR